MLGEQDDVETPIPATPWQDIPALYQRLTAYRTIPHLCLMWMILTVVRSDGCRGASLEEIDGDVWTVPVARVKGRKGRVSDFRVPLSQPALEVMEQCRPGIRDGLIFSSPKKGCLSSTALHKAMRKLNEGGRPHGLRTSFRTWVQDTKATTRCS